jgi:hypothetical protein
MNAALKARECIDAGSALIRVHTRDGLIRLEATMKGSGAAGGRTLLFPSITPPIALQLARRVEQAAAKVIQPSLPYRSQRSHRARFSAADVAEMRRLRAAGFLLKAIAERFNCTTSAVAYQTSGLIDPAHNHWNRRSPEILDAIIRMHAWGASVKEIAAELRCSESGVRAVIRRHEDQATRPAPNPGPVHQLPLTFRPQLVPEE